MNDKEKMNDKKSYIAFCPSCQEGLLTTCFDNDTDDIKNKFIYYKCNKCESEFFIKRRSNKND